MTASVHFTLLSPHSPEAKPALGGAGHTRNWPVERYLHNAKLLDIGAGTSRIRRMLIGRELIGSGQ